MKSYFNVLKKKADILPIGLFLISILIISSNIFSLDSEDIDPDTKVYLETLEFNEIPVMYQHPGLGAILWISLKPFRSTGMDIITSLKTIYFFYFTTLLTLMLLFGKKLFSNWNTASVISAIIGLSPPFLSHSSVLEDNIYSQVFLVLSWFLIFSKSNSIFKLFFGIFIYSVSFFTSLSMLIWFPFILFFVFLQSHKILKNSLYVFMFIVLGILLTSGILWLLLGFIYSDSSYVLNSMLAPYENYLTTMRLSPEELKAISPESYHLKYRVGRMEFFLSALAASFIGWLSVSIYFSLNFFYWGQYIGILILLSIYYVLLYSTKQNCSDKKSLKISLFLIIFFSMNLFFVFIYKDLAFMERLDFIFLLLPFFFYIFGISRKNFASPIM